MRLTDRLRSWWIFLWQERVGYRRPVATIPPVPHEHRVSLADHRFRFVQEQEARDLRTTLRLLDNDVSIFRRPQ